MFPLPSESHGKLWISCSLFSWSSYCGRRDRWLFHWRRRRRRRINDANGGRYVRREMRRGRPSQAKKWLFECGKLYVSYKVLKPSKKRRCSIKKYTGTVLYGKCSLLTKNGGMRLAFKAFSPPKLSPAFPDSNARSKKIRCKFFLSLERFLHREWLSAQAWWDLGGWEVCIAIGAFRITAGYLCRRLGFKSACGENASKI